MQGASAIGGAEALCVRVISDPAELPDLRTACVVLRSASADRPAALDLPYFYSAWDAVVEGRLHIVAIGRGLELAALWPLYVSDGTVRLLGSGSNEEYGGILGRIDETMAELALDAALAGGRTLEVYNLRPDDPLTRAIEKHGRFHRMIVHSPIISIDGSADAWRAGKSKSFRQTIRNARNRLAKLGHLAIGRVDKADAGTFTRWLFDTKRQWLDANGVGASWIRQPQSERFFASLIGDPASNVIGFALTLDGSYVAGSILLLSKDIEFFLVANDPSFAQFSPGQLVLDGLIDFAADAGTNIDLRITQDAYKLRWADRSEDRVSYIVARDWRGLAPVLRSRVRGGLLSVRTHLGRVRRSIMRKAAPR